jgi:ABC-type dipeptide/oligopeptide/nickel transport system permease component
MGAFIIRRLLWAIPVLLLVSIITFTMMQLVPGGPFSTSTSGRPIPPQIRANMEARFGLDKPAWQQYLIYMKGVIFEFDLGPSMRKPGRTVNQIIFGNQFWSDPMASPIMISVQIGIYSLILAIIVGIPLGIISALKRNTWVDYSAMTISILGVSIPNFVLGLLLILLFANTLGWLPTFGWGESWKQAVMPVITLGTAGTAIIARLTRASMLETFGQDFVRTARAKGLRDQLVVSRHVLRNSLIPVVTIMGPLAAAWLTGSFLIEIIFSIGGIGKFFVTSISDRDYTLIMATVLIYTTAVVFFNLIVDVAYGFLDPRIRYD